MQKNKKNITKQKTHYTQAYHFQARENKEKILQEAGSRGDGTNLIYRGINQTSQKPCAQEESEVKN